MQVRNNTTGTIRVKSRGSYYWDGTWLPTDAAYRPKIRNDQILEVRRGMLDCKDFNTLTTYGKLCDNYKDEVDRIVHILITERGDGGSRNNGTMREAIEYVLKWFMARVQGKAIQAPRKAVKKVVKRAARTRIGTIHLNTGCCGGWRYKACGGQAPLEETTTIRERVTCGSCQRTNKYRGLRPRR